MRAALLFELQQHQADDLDDLFVLYDAFAGAAAPDDPPVEVTDPSVLSTGAARLGDPDVADAFFSDVAGQDPERAETVAAFARALTAATAATTDTRAHRAARAGAAWLSGQARHSQQRVGEVEAFLDTALDQNPTYRPALELGAHYASDRGDAPRAISLARRAGVPESDEWVQMLSTMVPRARNDIGRNDPCFCGSGRKYKQCHLRQTTIELDERAYWLWRKAVDHLQDSPWQHTLVAVANELLAVEQTTYDSMTYAMTDPVVADIVLFEAGGWDDFLACRGTLLPADELALAQRWSNIPRSLFEVVGIDPGRSVNVRDERSGATHEVRETTYSATALVGDVFYGRVAPAGPTEQFFGGLVPVTTEMHDGLRSALDAPATTSDAGATKAPPAPPARVLTIARWLRPVLATVADDLPDDAPDDALDGPDAERVREPAGLRTVEGEPVVYIVATATLAAADLDPIVDALDARPDLERAGPDPVRHEATDADGHDGARSADLPSAFGADHDEDAALGPVVARWSAPIEVRGQQWIRGTVTVHGAHPDADSGANAETDAETDADTDATDAADAADAAGDATIVVRANAEVRYDRFCALMAEVAPAVELHRDPAA